MDLNILKVLASFALLQIVLWFVYLLTNKKSNALQKNFLLKLSVLFSIFISGVLLLLFGNSSATYFIANLTNLTVFLALPIMYTHLNNENSVMRIFHHYLPFGFLLFAASTILLFTNVHNKYFHSYSMILIGLFYMQCIYYAYLFRTRVKLKALPYIGWFKPFIFGFTILVILKTSIYAVWNVFSLYELCIILCSLFFISSFILINLLILVAMIRGEYLLPRVKYSGSATQVSDIDETYQLIYKELIENGAYREPLVNLHYISKKLLIAPPKISRTINEKLGKNFNEVINERRVHDAKQLLGNTSSDKTILDIAYEVGFNSKSTFNTAFKKYTGVTPSEYRKNKV